jgi:hypothetical protein
MRDGWTPSELHEFARLHFFKNGRDYPTAWSYRHAIADIVFTRRVESYAQAEPYYGRPLSWLKLFREGGSKPLPPRREGLLQRGRGLATIKCPWMGPDPLPNRVSAEEYAWPGHSEEYRAMIEQRAREYFKIGPGQPVHVNAWAASQRAYWRELDQEDRELEREQAREREQQEAKATRSTTKKPRYSKKGDTKE